MRDKIAKWALEAGLCSDRTGEEIADSILALLDAQRCVWTVLPDGSAIAGCKKERWVFRNMKSQLEEYPFCPCCGRKIEVAPN